MKPSRTPTPKSRYSTFRGPEFEFAFPKDKAYKKFIRNLKTIDPTYWGVLDADGKLIRRKPQKRKKSKN